jgi:hypothetical protein
MADEGNLTGRGSTLGTIAYMSPEQARGQDLDGRSDVFSLGLVLYEMVTGRQAFAGETTAVVFDGILNRTPRAPSELNSDVPPDLERIIARAIEKDRDARYQGAAELTADLRHLKEILDAAKPGALGAQVALFHLYGLQSHRHVSMWNETRTGSAKEISFPEALKFSARLHHRRFPGRPGERFIRAERDSLTTRTLHQHGIAPFMETDSGHGLFARDRGKGCHGKTDRLRRGFALRGGHEIGTCPALLVETRRLAQAEFGEVVKGHSMFDWARSYVRANNQPAGAEIERVGADSKFFRSLCLLSWLALALFLLQGEVLAGLVAWALAAFSYHRFCKQRWDNTLRTYEYFVQIKSREQAQRDDSGAARRPS